MDAVTPVAVAPVPLAKMEMPSIAPRSLTDTRADACVRPWVLWNTTVGDVVAFDV